ncbi:hypothetical protein BDQ12DRAFT_591651, partial [Crucibulum laeve]
PDYEFVNSAALETIEKYPHLFKIVTPIKVGHFEQLLTSHPNKTLVESVTRSLREGCWPWADTSDSSYPVTWDNSHRPLKSEVHAAFIRQQRDQEISLEHFLPGFGSELLPGMFSIPIGVVPKPHSAKLRLVVDHSAEPYSLNSMIPHECVSVPLDSLHNLGHTL